jgi:hypothetical protein
VVPVDAKKDASSMPNAHVVPTDDDRSVARRIAIAVEEAERAAGRDEVVDDDPADGLVGRTVLALLLFGRTGRWDRQHGEIADVIESLLTTLRRSAVRDPAVVADVRRLVGLLEERLK